MTLRYGWPLVLQLAPIGALADRGLAEQFGAVRLWEQDEAVWVDGHRAVVGLGAASGPRGRGEATIAAMPSLRAICSWRAGFDTIDVRAAHARGVQVSNTPDVLDDCVADLAW